MNMNKHRARGIDQNLTFKSNIRSRSFCFISLYLKLMRIT